MIKTEKAMSPLSVYEYSEAELFNQIQICGKDKIKSVQKSFSRSVANQNVKI